VPLSIGLLTTYPLTRCGLATSWASLRAQLVASGVRWPAVARRYLGLAHNLLGTRTRETATGTVAAR